MRFVDCKFKKNAAFLDLSGFEITILLLELVNLESHIVSDFEKFKGLYNFQKAVVVSHNNLCDNVIENIMQVRVVISFPDKLIDTLSLDLVKVKNIFSKSTLGETSEYKYTFDKLYVVEKEIIKLFDKNYIMPVVTAEDLGKIKKDTILFDE